jgi:hypothetical protein
MRAGNASSADKPTAWDSDAVEFVVIIGLVVLVALFFYGSSVRRVDAPVNPPGRVRIRRRYDFWRQSLGTVVSSIFFFVLGVVVCLAVHRTDPPGGQNVAVSAPASGSPDRAAVVSTMNDYFAGFNSRPTCRYTSAFSGSFRPPTMLADCKSTLSSTPQVQHITVGRNGSVNVQVTFVSRRKPEAGQSHDVCTTWTSDFRMNTEAGQLRIAEPPAFRGRPTKC